jgi:hypothetical protein
MKMIRLSPSLVVLFLLGCAASTTVAPATEPLGLTGVTQTLIELLDKQDKTNITADDYQSTSLHELIQFGTPAGYRLKLRYLSFGYSLVERGGLVIVGGNVGFVLFVEKLDQGLSNAGKPQGLGGGCHGRRGGTPQKKKNNKRWRQANHFHEIGILLSIAPFMPFTCIENEKLMIFLPPQN